MKVYGPYNRKDGRQHVIIIHDDGRRQTQSYPRFLKEVELGRKLNNWEEIDHIDDDKSNNDINNFQVLTKSDNIKKEMMRSHRKMKIVKCICLECSSNFERRLSYYKHSQINQKKAGPFCSRKCAGKHNQRLRLYS